MATTTTMNINTILDNLVVIVREIIGTDLAQVKANTSGATRPAIIKSRTTDKNSTNQPNVELPYPYAVIDYIDTDLWGGAELINEYTLEDGNRVYETDLLVNLSIEVVGRLENNVHTIGNKLQRYMRTPVVRARFPDLMGARLFSVSDLKKGVIPRSSEWVDMSTLKIEIIIRDVLTTDSEGNIDHIIVNGELHNSFIDPDPILINIDTEE